MLIVAENQVEEMIERAATLGLAVGEVPVGSLLGIFNQELKLFFQLHEFGRSQVMMLKSTNKRLRFDRVDDLGMPKVNELRTQLLGHLKVKQNILILLQDLLKCHQRIEQVILYAFVHY